MTVFIQKCGGIECILSGKPRGTLRISCPTYFAAIHLVPLINTFCQQYPEINIELMVADRFVDIVDEGYDLAIRITSKPDPEVIARRLAACRHVYVASPEYLAKKPAPKTPEELHHHKCILYSHTTEWQFTKDGKSHSVKITPSVKSNNTDVILATAVDGMGITLMPTFLASEALGRGELETVLDDNKTFEPQIYAVYASQHHLPAKVRVFFDYLKERIIDPPYWDHFFRESEDPAVATTAANSMRQSENKLLIAQ